MGRLLRQEKLHDQTDGWAPARRVAAFLHRSIDDVLAVTSGSFRKDGLPYFNRAMHEGEVWISVIPSRRAQRARELFF